jgi:hypothetical protein
MTALKPDQALLQMLDAERDVAPPSGSLERDWARLSGALSTGAPALAVGSVSLKAGSSVLGKLGGGVAVGMLLGAGAAAGVQALQNDTRKSDTTAALAASVAPLARGARAAPPPSSVAPAASTARPVDSATTGARAPEPSSRRPAARDSPDFDAELRLIELAKKQLDAGQPHLARVWLNEHQSRYPLGVFAVERRALFTLAACAERSPDAAGAAADFTRLYPTSPFIDRIASACAAQAGSRKTPGSK